MSRFNSQFEHQKQNKSGTSQDRCRRRRTEMHLGPPKLGKNVKICLKMSKFVFLTIKGTSGASQLESSGDAGRSKQVPCLKHGGAPTLCFNTQCWDMCWDTMFQTRPLAESILANIIWPFISWSSTEYNHGAVPVICRQEEYKIDTNQSIKAGKQQSIE